MSVNRVTLDHICPGHGRLAQSSGWATSARGELAGVIEATERHFERLDVMVANAGLGILCRAIAMSLADWRRKTAVNLDGVFLSVNYGDAPAVAPSLSCRR
jgi:NAD(P)-dependent dehydrogenase (short-subunit alcohol dehydrogenase family)